MSGSRSARRAGRKPTMRDVARLAGVSQSTVSFVVNDRRDMRITDYTRERVLEAINALGFRPDLTARGLRLQRTQTIGFITDEIATSPFAGRTVQGAQELAWKHGRLLFVINTGGDAEVEAAAVDTLLDRRVDGLIYAAMSAYAVRPIPKLTEVPAVLVNCFPVEGWAVPAVVPSEVRGGALAAQAALAVGHQRIVYLAGNHGRWSKPGAWATSLRKRGFRAALGRAGLGVEASSIVDGEFSADSGYDRALTVMRRRPRPTALVCGNDRIALGALFALRDLSLRVPEDVSVVGYDDQEEFAALTRPPLTTVSLPHYEMGRRGVESLLSLIAGKQIPKRQSVPGRLVERGSLRSPDIAQ